MSTRYYDLNAPSFTENTLHVDMSDLYRRFLSFLTERAYILYCGCGSGRDSLAFLRLGYQVEAIDASPEMVKTAKEITGLNVLLRSFDEIEDVKKYDGIWACASLLHVPSKELNAVLKGC
jgi:2-polyprenyl-3-methyl-5-hydroxy-6-metoxy-1,4-benzoquinol methylase